MNWSSLSDFAAMGGDAQYVWGSYLMVLGALVWELVLMLQRRRRAREDVREYALINGNKHDATS